ncbi:two-component system, chemotaxis family, sensor kinase CheA [Jannaschia faecimaris]|uniref:Chemotaxis protein CheA n=1 Tax=Jannaschia faecimaris TaxID=1244108 RepID=A0A1H3QVH7_9RHOB|nr:chemotaxis protein CheA [Jannaschia faecimaris]SDZ17602.1 two-component system, chemotaxis family, sensor kinase CheA [Jannaschia faecimaris]
MNDFPTDTFVAETLEGLEAIESLLLRFEDSPNAALVDDLFRTMHTIKGSGAMFGYDALARFTHLFENAFELVRGGELPLDRVLIDLSLAARDHMAELLNHNGDPARLVEIETSDSARNLERQIAGFVKSGAPGPERGHPVAPVKHFASSRTVRIRYAPASESFRFGARPNLLLEELYSLGNVDLSCDATAVPCLAKIDPQASYLVWNVQLKTDRLLEDIREIFVFVDEAEFSITDENGILLGPVMSGKDENVVGDALPIERAASDKSRANVPSLRIPATRLDDLMDQLGELVIAQAKLASLAVGSSDPALNSVSEEVNRLIAGLRESALSMRMLPIEIAFGKFRRIVRSLADDLGKNIRLVTEGGQTELDKNVIDGLTEPLVHMIRNAIDHGIECRAERIAAGKSEEATVALVARQSGGEVLISVSDDGGGLNESTIRTRAVERGLIGPDEILAPEELHQMIFEPAFSTAQTVSNVSGRGVGMDAVRKVVADLRGAIDIRTGLGVGTSITLRLPVTLAIIDGLLVRVGDGVFVVPLSAVHECVELNNLDYDRASGRTLLKIRDELVPFVKLDRAFGKQSEDGTRRRVVIVNDQRLRVGLVVDDVIGQHQTVIKTFSRFHRNIPGFAGSTILGDGQVALILDPPALLRSIAEDQVAGVFDAA